MVLEYQTNWLAPLGPQKCTLNPICKQFPPTSMGMLQLLEGPLGTSFPRADNVDLKKVSSTVAGKAAFDILQNESLKE
eukprot:10398462-Ditylum_brightwellii.AAC.1